MFNGRLFQMSLELAIASFACLVAAILLPSSVWQTLGEVGSSLAILIAGALITGCIVLRNRPAVAASTRHASLESAG